MRLIHVAVLLHLSAVPLPAQTNPRFRMEIDGPCGETIVGPPGTSYDDGTGGAGLFLHPGPFLADTDGDGRSDLVRKPKLSPGHTWSIALTTSDNSFGRGAQGWWWALATEGALDITDVTTHGTPGCARGLSIRLPDEFPECRRMPSGFARTAFTGPPDGEGPQTEENKGVIGVIIISEEPFRLPPDWRGPIAKLRVSAEFPASEGEVLRGRISFTPRTGTSRTYFPLVFYEFDQVTEEVGAPPLEVVEDCEVFFKAVSVAGFVRCDPNDDGGSDIADAVWIFTELFRGGPVTQCPAAADCNADGMRDLSDAIYALEYQFTGGLPPPAPFPDCERLDIAPEDCPLGSTRCP